MKKVFTIVISLVLVLSLAPTVALANNGDILLSTATYEWTDPASGQEVEITENVYKTGDLMKWEYVVYNIDYDPEPGITNGFSGFQIVFPQQVPEVANQMSPAIGGPWHQNAYSGTAPPWGVEWDTPYGVGIMPGQTGVFSYTTEEREREVVSPNSAGWAHTWKGDLIIDLDGTATAGVGDPLTDQEVVRFDTLTPFYTGFYIEGLDWFDNDASLNWTAGDDLHVEDPTTHPGAIRDGLHQFVDPVVLDLNGSLWQPQPVNVDLETGTIDPAGAGVPGAPDPQIKFFDTNGNTFWDDGEDIVLDINNNSVYDRDQYYIFYGENSVPGDPYMDITKELVDAYDTDEMGDSTLDLNEKWEFVLNITVTNPSSTNVTNVMVKDNFGGDLELVSTQVDGGTIYDWSGYPLTKKKKDSSLIQGEVTVEWSGKSEKAHLFWNVEDGTLSPGETHTLTVVVATDMNPAGHQQYTSEGDHYLNSGATAKGFVMWDSIEFEVDYTTDPIMVTTGTNPM